MISPLKVVSGIKINHQSISLKVNIFSVIIYTEISNQEFIFSPKWTIYTFRMCPGLASLCVHSFFLHGEYSGHFSEMLLCTFLVPFPITWIS